MSKHSLTVVSLGNGDPGLLNTKTMDALRSECHLILRTGRHPVVSWLESNNIAFDTLDDIYEHAEDFDRLNHDIAERLLQCVSLKDVVYAVPDACTDHSVRTLFSTAMTCADIHVIPGISSYDLNLSSVLRYTDNPCLTVVPACDFLSDGIYDPNRSLLITELDNPILAGEVKIMLSEMLGDHFSVCLITDSEHVSSVPLFQIDRQKNISHLSSLYVPCSAFIKRDRFVLNDLIALMERLRAQDGCPWDRIQTHNSLRPYVVEEAWECVDAIDRNDMDHLCEELGDLLFQVIFHSSIGKAYDEFSINDVITSICQKMIRRHPHVFSDGNTDDPEEVKAAWEQIKRRETGHAGLAESLDDISVGLPALKYAAALYKKLKQTVFTSQMTRSNTISDIIASAGNIQNRPGADCEDELGTLLLKCAELCSELGIDGELVLHQAAVRLKKKIADAEKNIINDGKSLEHLTFEELGVYLHYAEEEI